MAARTLITAVIVGLAAFVVAPLLWGVFGALASLVLGGVGINAPVGLFVTSSPVVAVLAGLYGVYWVVEP